MSKTAKERTPEELVEVLTTIGNEFLASIEKEEVEAIHVPLAIAIVFNRAGQILQIPASAIVDESVERLMGFQDLKSLKEGKTPQNGTLKPLVDEIMEKQQPSNIVKPAAPLLNEEGIPIADENTWLNQ